jgi:hypothetical protein
VIRQLLAGFAGIGVTGVGAVVALTMTPTVLAAAAGGLLVVLGCSALTWAVGAA